MIWKMLQVLQNIFQFRYSPFKMDKGWCFCFKSIRKYSIFNFIDSEKYKMIIKDGSIYIKQGRKILDDVDYDYDSIYLNEDIKANFYEK